MHEQKFLFITLFLVCLIGAPAVYSVVKEPLQPKASSLNSSITKQDSKQDRGPANSIEDTSADSSRPNSIKSKSVVLDVPCKGKSAAQEVDGNLLRLKSGTCANQKWQNVSVVNQTNGFTSSVIYLKDDQFTTDFIDLDEGENKLEIKATNEKGHEISQFLVVKRRAPASL